MPTNEERREVAARLRGDPYDTLIPYRTGIHFGMGCHEAANRFWDMCERIKSAGDYDIAYSTRSVLADLIEPEPERTARLEYDEVHGCNICTGCGERYKHGMYMAVTYDDFIAYKPMRYCPACGARLEGVVR